MESCSMSLKIAADRLVMILDARLRDALAIIQSSCGWLAKPMDKFSNSGVLLNGKPSPGLVFLTNVSRVPCTASRSRVVGNSTGCGRTDLALRLGQAGRPVGVGTD